MSGLVTEAAALSRWSDAERLCALKRIIPRRSVTEALRAAGRSGCRACGVLPDWFVVWFVVGIGLFCGDCYRQVYRWLVRRAKGRPVPPRSTLCEARQRLGVRPLAALAKRVVGLLADASRPGDAPAFYRGMRLMALDGFVLDLPDTTANDRVFGRPTTGRAQGAFPQARVLALCEAGTHVMWRWLLKPYRCGETTMAPPLLRHLRPGMLLLWDRNFLKYAHVRQVLDAGSPACGTHLLARVKSDVTLAPRKRLGDGSYLARLYRNKYDRDRDRNGIDVRVVRYTLRDPNRPGHREEHRLLTTLLDEKLDPAKDLVELYHVRWEQELAIDEIKTHEMERPVLRSRTPTGVVQEVYGLLLAHFVVRSLMHEAAAQKRLSPLRLSFTAALKILRCRLPQCPRGRRGIRQWWRDLLEEVAEETLPPRRDRTNPRVIKRKMSNWKKKRAEHLNYPQPRKKFRDSIVVLH
jgi:transposase IS4-like protein/DDE family transposase